MIFILLHLNVRQGEGRGRLRDRFWTPVLLSLLTNFLLEVSLDVTNNEFKVHILALLGLRPTVHIGLVLHMSHKVV